MIGTKKNTFQLELKNRFTALEEHDDMDSLNKNMTEIIQQSAMSIAKQTKRQKKPKMSSPTKALMKKRREMIENNTPRDHIEYVEICKTIKKKAREDIRKHNLDEIRETIEASKSLKKVRRTQNLGKNRMITLLDKHGKEIQEQDKIMERIEEFYSELYDSDQAVTIQTVPKEVPPIMAWEVEAALRKMKNGKEAGNDQVNIETLKAGDETIAKQLAKLYTKCITERRIPKTWKEANMVIFFKKGNRKDIKNYRPICLLSNMYKLFTKIITTRLENKLDENQPREQAGFRSKYSTTDHIHAINQLKEKCREYNIPLCVAFVDYEKAFDSIQTQAILTSLQEQGIEDVYIEILKDIYTDSSVTVHLHKESEKIRIKRGVRQGDTISPKLFTATLESIFRRLNWEHKGVKIDGEFLSNLRFADDIFLCTETPQELQHMLQELSDESRRMGLKMNIAKTKVMVVDNTPININNVLIENVQGYVYLGQHYSLKGKEPGQRDTTKNHGRLGGIRQTPGYLQKQPCHLPKETGVQLLCAASYDIWCRDMDPDQTSTEQTCGRTDKNGKKYAQHHIQRQKDQHLGQGEDKSHRYNQHRKKNEMVLGRAYQPPQRRPMDLAYHQLETI